MFKFLKNFKVLLHIFYLLQSSSFSSDPSWQSSVPSHRSSWRTQRWLSHSNLFSGQYFPLGYRAGQSISSERSKQSRSPSHFSLSLMQCPLVHWNLSAGHWWSVQSRSSDPSPQSSSWSHFQRAGIHFALSHWNSDSEQSLYPWSAHKPSCSSELSPQSFSKSQSQRLIVENNIYKKWHIDGYLSEYSQFT